MNMIRQGDVLLLRTTERGAREIARGSVVLAEGEVTGHAHRITDPAAVLLEENGIRYLQATEAVMLRHEEHEALTIPAGFYQVVIQSEYSPEAIHNVAD